MRGLLLAALACVCAWPASVSAAVGDLDSSFGSGGTFVLGLPKSSFGAGLVITADGSIVVGGAAKNALDESDLMAFRLTPAGAIDPSFGPSATGYGLYDLGGNEHGNGIALSPAGKIYLVGDTDTGPDQDFAVARLTPNGVFDPTFGFGTGSSTFGFGNDEYGSSIALQPDGKPVIGGQSNLYGTQDLAVARILDPEGTLDPSYGLGTGGSVMHFGGAEYGSAVALQPDGKILALGFTYQGNSDEKFAIGRVVSPQGTFDPTFGPGGDGTALVNFGPAQDEPTSIAVQPDGKILLAGETDAPGTSDFAIARLLANGTLDPSFGTGGKQTIDFSGASEANAQMALQPDGRIVIVGTTRPAAGDTVMAAFRLTADGTLDSTFGTGGKVTHPVGSSPEVDAVALAPNGDIVASGSLYSNFTYSALVVRIEGDRPVEPPPPVATKVKCAGKTVTLVGTARGEKLKGTGKPDVIAGLGGNDRIFALGGNDLICGGAGKDRLYGGKGKDRLLGQAGRDVLRGGKGRDKLAGGPGKDSQKQ